MLAQAAIGFLCLLLAAQEYFFATRSPASLVDLNVYRDAILFALQGRSLYDFHSVDLGGQGFLYPPAAAVLLSPVTWMAAQVAGEVWTAATLVVSGAATLVACAGLRSRAAARGDAAVRLLWPGAAIMITLMSTPLVNNVVCGQVSVFVIALSLADAAHLLPERLRGAGIGLASAVKLTPLLFVPYLLVTRQFRAAAVATGTFGLATALGWWVYPADSSRYWTLEVFATGHGGAAAGFDNHSIFGALVRWGFTGSPLVVANLVFAVVAAPLALSWAHRAASLGEHLAAALIVSCTIAAIAPISWSHHFFGVVLAGLYLVATGRRECVVSGILTILSCSIVFVMAVGQAGFWGSTEGSHVLAEVPLVMAFVAMAALARSSQTPGSGPTGEARPRPSTMTL
jgi:alpha-1,2-mannosyltransferase